MNYIYLLILIIFYLYHFFIDILYFFTCLYISVYNFWGPQQANLFIRLKIKSFSIVKDIK